MYTVPYAKEDEAVGGPVGREAVGKQGRKPPAFGGAPPPLDPAALNILARGFAAAAVAPSNAHLLSPPPPIALPAAPVPAHLHQQMKPRTRQALQLPKRGDRVSGSEISGSGGGGVGHGGGEGGKNAGGGQLHVGREASQLPGVAASSMAALQGHLMMYRENPEGAVRTAHALRGGGW